MMVGPKRVRAELDLDSVINANMIAFENLHQNDIVGIVDVVNSTGIISKLTPEQACQYYSVFHNSLGYVLQNHGAKVVKNIGDGILYYFPDNEDLEKPLNCSVELLKANSLINNIFRKEKIPSISYRISLDYGPLMIAKYQTSSCSDIFGPTVNLCSKINRLAPPKGIVIGSDYYELAKKLKKYQFREISQFNSLIKQSYPVYLTYQK